MYPSVLKVNYQELGILILSKRYIIKKHLKFLKLGKIKKYYCILVELIMNQQFILTKRKLVLIKVDLHLLV